MKFVIAEPFNHRQTYWVNVDHIIAFRENKRSGSTQVIIKTSDGSEWYVPGYSDVEQLKKDIS